MTVDETWLHHFTPKSNRQSSECTAQDEPAPKRGKTQQSAGKVMASVFWGTHGIIFIDYFEKGRTTNSDYYIALLDRLKGEIAEKRPHLKKKKVLLTKTMHRITNQWKRRQKSINWASNCFYIHRILQICPQRLFPFLRSQKNSRREEIFTEWRSDRRNWDLFWSKW